MSLTRGLGDFFAMDIGTNVIRMIQLKGDSERGWSLQHFSYFPVPNSVMQDGSEIGKRKMGEAIMAAANQAGITTKNIAIGMPSRKTFTTIIEVPNQPDRELAKTIKYQIDQYVPMSLDEAKVDFTIIGQSPNNRDKTEVLLSSTASNYAEEMMEQVESLGFNVIAQEPEPIAMARSLSPLGLPEARVVIDLGEKSADIVATYLGAPRLVRALPGGLSLFVKTVAATLSVREDQARQFILKFGLAQDKLEGQVFRALDTTLDSFATELQKSVRFFQTKYPGVPFGGIILSGFAGVIPFMPEYIEARIGIPTIPGNPWQMVRVAPEQQQALVNVASEFAVVVGLAERSND